MYTDINKLYGQYYDIVSIIINNYFYWKWVYSYCKVYFHISCKTGCKCDGCDVDLPARQWIFTSSVELSSVPQYSKSQKLWGSGGSRTLTLGLLYIPAIQIVWEIVW